MPKANIKKVYPRACGGTKYVLNVPPALDGLSPRVRGNHVPTATTNIPGRSIPARAGEPSDRGAAIVWGRVYPRACGGT